MKHLTFLLAAAALSAPLSSQALSESFDTSSTGIFPPSGWTETNNASGEIWVDSAAQPFSYLAGDAAGHVYQYLSGIPSDDFLIAPTMDLSSYGAPQLTFSSELQWPTYVDQSNVDISVDGGVTWSQVWTETSTASGLITEIVDLSGAAASQSNVEMRFHYYGDNAHNWAVDDVVVDNVGPTGPSLTTSGTCPGVMSLDASGMTVGGPVVFAYSLSGGTFVVPGGACAGLSVGMGAPVQLGTMPADASGNASYSGNAPANACGQVIVVAVDGATCTISNIVGL